MKIPLRAAWLTIASFFIGAVSSSAQGTLQVAGKTYKLEHAIAYETKFFDDKVIAVLLCTKPIDVEKLKTALKAGDDHGFTLFEPQVKLSFDQSGKLMFVNIWADNNSISTGGTLEDAKVEVTFPSGRVRGKVAMAREKDSPAYRLDVAFDVEIIKTPQAAREPEPKEAESKSSAAIEQPRAKDLPIPKDATGYKTSGEMIEFASPSNVQTVTEFLSKNFEQQGWTKAMDAISDTAAVLNRSKGEASLTLFISEANGGSKITIMTKGLSWDEAKPGGESAGPTRHGPPELIALDRDGLPIPGGATDVGETKTPFRQSLHAKSRTALNRLVDFYRAELPARGWTELKPFAKIGAKRAELGFEGPLGELTLTLQREGDATNIGIATKNRQAAQEAGVRPKSGQGKLIIGNSSAEEAVVTVNKQEYKIAAGAGANSPKNALNQDVQPGKYTVAVKLSGQEIQTETFQIAAFETWGVMIGATGQLAVIQLY